MNDVTRDFYERHARLYEEKTRDLVPVSWLEAFVNLLKPGGHVLDLGCAYGRESKIFVERGFRVTGIDFSEKLVQRAKESVPSATFLVQDIRTMDFENASFDGIWASAVLLHFSKKEIPHILQMLHAILRSGGPFFISVRGGRGEEVISDSRYAGAKRFFNFYTEEELKSLITDAKFEIMAPPKTSRKHDYDTMDMIHTIVSKP